MQKPDMPLLVCNGLTKSFAGVRVLKGVSVEVERGTVLGLVGENGAGKSTLMNLIGGIHRPDTGSMHLDGKPYAPSGPLDASRRGVAFVHQELNLFGNLSIADNIFITGFPKRVFSIDRNRMHEGAAELLTRVDLNVSPDTAVDALPQGERQLVEIAKALNTNARLIIFDEPTTSLSPREAKRLFAAIEKLRGEGIGVIYISHALEDVRRLCRRIVVLRDGETVGAGSNETMPLDRIISLMVGRPIDQLYPSRGGAPSAEIRLQARGLSQPGIIESVSFELHAGEILGVAGLMGSGRSEMARVLFGLDPCRSGEVLLEGTPMSGGPRERIARGLAMLTESRRDDGLFMDASVAENLEIVHPEPARVPQLASSLRLAAANLDRQPVKQLSGGNQQKVALGKWLMRQPKVLILDEPTRGIDVGAKYEIYRLINELADSGVAVLVISSEIEEVMGICDRVLVMRKGEISSTFAQPFYRETILGAAV